MRSTLLLLALVAVVVGCEVSTPSTQDRVVAASAVESRPSAQSSETLPEPEPIEEEAAPGEGKDDPALAAARAKLLTASKRHKALAKPLQALADKIDDYRNVGNLYNEVGVQEARCFARGTLLGLDPVVAHLDDEGAPDLQTMTGENAHALRVQAYKHLNFANVIEGTINAERDETVVRWNLDCPGRLGISAESVIDQTGITSFYEVHTDGLVLSVFGDIEEGFADKVISALKANPSVRTVSLGSGGGYVHEAIRAGTYIRENGYDTRLWNGCYSACPLVFIGGNNREIYSPYPELGFHQVARSDGISVPTTAPIYSDIESYVRRMGVDSDLVMTTIKVTPAYGMFRIPGSDVDLCEFNVATWIQRLCHSDSHSFPEGL